MKAKEVAILVLASLLVVIGGPAVGSEDVQTLGADLTFQSGDFSQGTHERVVSGPDGLTLSPTAVTGRYTSPVVLAPLDFNAVVPQWIADVPATASMTIRLRTASADGLWTDWFQIRENDDWMLPEDTDIVGQMIAVPAVDVTHRQIQYSVAFSRYQDGSGATLRQIRLSFIDSTRGPSAEELVARQEALNRISPSAPESGYPKPFVVSRQVWCTDPACNYTSGLEYKPVTHLVVHHTVSSNSSSDWAAIVRAIWRFHTFTRGWGDVGYNYLVDVNGVLYEGHLGGDDVVGTHAAGANSGSMGLALIGTFTTPSQNPPGIAPPPAMLDSAAALFAWKADQKNINVFDASRLPVVSSPYPNVGWGLPNLMGHRDVHGTTTCPGDQAHGLLPWLRNEVASRLGFVSPHIYIDEMSSAFTKSNSNWYTASAGCGFNGHAYYTWSTTDSGQSTNWGEWRPLLGASGLYDLQVYAPYCVTGEAETGGARYEVTHAHGTDTIVVSHEDHVGTWMSLGVFEFNAGNSTVVRLTDFTSTDSGLGVWFDAIRFRPSTSPPPVTVTNQQPVTNAWIKQRTANFGWNTTNPSWVSETKLEVAADSQFSQLVASEIVPNTQMSHAHTFGQDYQQLYWRVAATTLFNQSVTSSPYVLGVDTAAPTSQVQAIYVLEDGSYVVGWSGTDATSGIGGYDIDYRAEGESLWTSWLSNTLVEAASFIAPDSRVYWFRSRAVDRAGNAEALHPSGDASTSQAVLLRRASMFPLIFHD